MNLDWIVGEFNNFQQYWLENTDDEMHRVDTPYRHRHIHLVCEAIDQNKSYALKLYAGRDKKELSTKHILSVENGNVFIDGKIVNTTSEEIKGDVGYLRFRDGTLHFSGLGILEDCGDTPYVLMPCRYFSGWIQYPPNLEEPDELYSQRELEIHDQGGNVELDVEGVDYTVELTQLVYAKTLKIMKLAVYDIPKAELGINSKAISYTWVESEAKRIGINLRKLISGWTLIEPGYINSNNLNKNN